MSRRPLGTAVLGVALLMAWGTAARAERVGNRVVLDHAEAQPSFFDGLARVRLFTTAIKLEGAQIPIPATDGLIFQIGAKKQRLPYLLGTFEGTDADLAAALVVEVGHEYEADLPLIVESLTRHLRDWPQNSKVTLVRYGQSVSAESAPRSPLAVASLLSDLQSDLEPAPPRLLEAVNSAIEALAAVRPSRKGRYLRKVIVVISDGKDAGGTPAAFKATADRARAEDIRVHSLAYSPVDNRRPLLGLGELSKRSRGTFRWVRAIINFDSQLRTLATELRDQYVVTAFAPEDTVKDSKVSITLGELSSNVVSLGEPRCGASTCGGGEYCAASRCVEASTHRSLWTWLLYALLAAALLVLLLVVVGWLMGRREREREASRQRAAAIMGHQAAAQQQAAGHRVVAQGPQGQLLAPLAQARPPATGPRQPQGPIAGVGPGGQVHRAAGPTPVAAASGFVTLLTTRGAGPKLPLRHGFNIGSAPNCDLVINDPAASAYHAQIVFDAAGGALIVDRGSTNGTVVNGTRVSKMRLTHGAMITIGSTTIRYLAG